jgi:hypothetical protein
MAQGLQHPVNNASGRHDMKFYGWGQKDRVKREPLYTLEEIADRLGVNYDNLKLCMRNKNQVGYPEPPKCAMMTGGSSPVRMRTQLYKLSEFKRWMRELQEFNSKRQGDTT